MEPAVGFGAVELVTGLDTGGTGHGIVYVMLQLPLWHWPSAQNAVPFPH